MEFAVITIKNSLKTHHRKVEQEEYRVQISATLEGTSL